MGKTPAKAGLGSTRSLGMKRIFVSVGISVPAVLILLNLFAGWAILPSMLLNAPLPARTEAERSSIRTKLCPPGCAWTNETLTGGEGRPLTIWRLHRPASRGIAVLLHGFGDDAWGGVSRLKDLPELDAVAFTFRNRDLAPGTPSTLGGWEREDTAAVEFGNRSGYRGQVHREGLRQREGRCRGWHLAAPGSSSTPGLP